ncbi:MAG: YceI family protein [Bacteroidales bacterium]
MKLTTKILVFASAMVLCGNTGNTLLSFGLPKEDPLGTGCVNFLVINGESNINKFSFSYMTPVLARGDDASKGAEYEKIDFMIPVHQFKPGNPRMYDDFLTLLKAKEYPYIMISLLTGNFTGERKSGISRNERIAVTIAGVTREYTVDCALANCNEDLVLNGMQTVRLTDFGLIPPVRLSGIVKVENEINVRFGFIVNFTD